MKIVTEIRCGRTIARLEMLEGTDEYSDGQPHSQHVRILDCGKTLSVTQTFPLGTASRRAADPVAACHAAPWFDVSGSRRRLSRHPTAVRSPGGVRRTSAARLAAIPAGESPANRG